MIDRADLQQLQNEVGVLQRRVGATEYSMSIDYLNTLIDTLDKLLAVKEAAEKIDKDMEINQRVANATKRGFASLRPMRLERVELFLALKKALAACSDPEGAK